MGREGLTSVKIKPSLLMMREWVVRVIKQVGFRWREPEQLQWVSSSSTPSRDNALECGR